MIHAKTVVFDVGKLMAVADSPIQGVEIRHLLVARTPARGEKTSAR